MSVVLDWLPDKLTTPGSNNASKAVRGSPDRSFPIPSGGGYAMEPQGFCKAGDSGRWSGGAGLRKVCAAGGAADFPKLSGVTVAGIVGRGPYRCGDDGEPQRRPPPWG